jgi:hypothetical protein
MWVGRARNNPIMLAAHANTEMCIQPFSNRAEIPTFERNNTTNVNVSKQNKPIQRIKAEHTNPWLQQGQTASKKL